MAWVQHQTTHTTALLFERDTSCILHNVLLLRSCSSPELILKTIRILAGNDVLLKMLENLPTCQCVQIAAGMIKAVSANMSLSSTKGILDSLASPANTFLFHCSLAGRGRQWQH